MLRNEKTGVFPHKMIKQHYGGEKGFWEYLKNRRNDNCLMGCNIVGKDRGPFILDGQPSGLIMNHAYAIRDVVELKKRGTEEIIDNLLVLRNPWGSSEFIGKWDGNSKEFQTYRQEL